MHFCYLKRSIKSESLLVKLTYPANSTTTVILKVTNSTGLRIPLTIWQQDAYLAHKGNINLVYGLLIGFVFSLAVSCLVLYGFSHKRYFAYAGVITLTLGFLLLYLCGFGIRYLHPHLPGVQQIMIPILLMLVTLLFLPLQRQICQPKDSKLFKVQRSSSKLICDFDTVHLVMLPNSTSDFVLPYNLPLLF